MLVDWGRSVMGKAGLEPARVAPHDPKSCTSANSVTSPRAALYAEVEYLASLDYHATASGKDSNCPGGDPFAVSFFLGDMR